MSIYHLSVKTVSRSAGRSATAAAAYRAGERIADERTGLVHDYTRRSGVVGSALVLPHGAPQWSRAQLWNAAEAAEKRSNSTVAREFELALPSELPAEARAELAHEFARELAERHSCAVDVAIHAPGKEGDGRNHHAHLLCTTRRLTPAGLSEKTRELDDKKTGSALVVEWRERWAQLVNQALERHGSDERVDHRSNAARGIAAAPSVHLGPQVSAILRRGGESHVLDRIVAEGEARALLAAGLDAEMAGLETALQEALQAQQQAQAEVLAAQAAQVAAERARLEPRPEPVPPVAVPPAERLVQVETELQRLRADLREREVRQSGVGVVVNTRAEVKKARAQAPALRRRFDEVARVVKDLAKERSELPWWRLVRAWQIRQQLPLAMAERSALAAQVKAVQAVASVPDAATVEARRVAMEGLRRQLTQLEGEAEGIKRQAREGALQVEREQLVQRVLQAHGQGPQEQPQARERPR